MMRPVANRVFRGIVVAVAAVMVCVDSPAQSLTDTNVRAVIEAIDEYRSANEIRIIKDFIELLSMPNVAVNLADMERNADHITGLLESRRRARVVSLMGSTILILNGSIMVFIEYVCAFRPRNRSIRWCWRAAT